MCACAESSVGAWETYHTCHTFREEWRLFAQQLSSPVNRSSVRMRPLERFLHSCWTLSRASYGIVWKAAVRHGALPFHFGVQQASFPPLHDCDWLITLMDSHIYTFGPLSLKSLHSRVAPL